MTGDEKDLSYLKVPEEIVSISKPEQSTLAWAPGEKGPELVKRFLTETLGKDKPNEWQFLCWTSERSISNEIAKIRVAMSRTRAALRAEGRNIPNLKVQFVKVDMYSEKQGAHMLRFAKVTLKRHLNASPLSSAAMDILKSVDFNAMIEEAEAAEETEVAS